MIEFFNFIQKLSDDKILFTRRFFPFVAVLITIVGLQAIYFFEMFPNPATQLQLSVVFLICAFALWVSAAWKLPHEKAWIKKINKLINECQYDAAEQALKNPPYLLGFAIRTERLLSLVQLNIERNNLLAAYSSAVMAEKQALQKKELRILMLKKAEIFYKAGNYNVFRSLLNTLRVNSFHGTDDKIRVLLLQSILAEIDNSSSDAKQNLEMALDISRSKIDEMIIYNNLARIEEYDGNKINARGYYERAWEALQECPLPAINSNVIHNLLIFYARSGDRSRALSLLESYSNAISNNVPEQVIQLLNDQIYLSRELKDRSLLIDAYKKAEEELFPLLNHADQFKFSVSQLRTRLNDDLDFFSHFETVIGDFQKIEDLTVEDRLHALFHIWEVSKQATHLLSIKHVDKIIEMVSDSLIQMEDIVDDKLRKTSPLIPSERDQWLGYKIEIIKFKIAKRKDGAFRSEISNLFKCINEKRSVWKDKGSSAYELKSLIGLCSEYISYGVSLGPVFMQDFYYEASKALCEAESIIEKEWPHPMTYEYAMGFAYYAFAIQGDRDKATLWLERFDNLGHSLFQHTLWFRGQYKELKSALAQS